VFLILIGLILTKIYLNNIKRQSYTNNQLKGYLTFLFKKEYYIQRFDFPILEIREVFDLFDTDKSGEIGQNELRTIIKSLNLNINDADLKSFIRNMDKNQNGKIEFSGRFFKKSISWN
jgi:hypothetical protein